MSSKLLDLWLYLRASYWFLPSLMAMAALLAAIALVQLDVRLGGDWFRNLGWLFANQPEGARSLLSTVAGSMITVAGVTFSMTLLAVSHASSQIGPRLLTGFMRDRGNQVTLGTFIATFLYCLTVLRTVHSGVSDGDYSAPAFVPNVAIAVAVVLAVLSVMVLIYFIHHVPQSINVSNVVAGVGDELVDTICNRYPEKKAAKSDGDVRQDCSTSGASGCLVRLVSDGGYLRVMDEEKLRHIAIGNGLVLEVLVRPGDYAVTGQAIVRVRPEEEVDDDTRNAIVDAFSWGNERTREQDVLFPVEQLLEILGKAMSPGINGQYTAVLCLNQFERALAALLSRSERSARHFDEDGNLRTIEKTVTHAEFVEELFGPLRQFIFGDWIATRATMAMLDQLRSIPALHEVDELLAAQAAGIAQDIKASDMSDAARSSLA